MFSGSQVCKTEGRSPSRTLMYRVTLLVATALSGKKLLLDREFSLHERYRDGVIRLHNPYQLSLMSDLGI